MRQQLLRKVLRLVFTFSLAVSDCKQLDTSLCFVITNSHTEGKSQVKVSYDMNSLTITPGVCSPWPAGQKWPGS